MKTFFCPECSDLKKLTKEKRQCMCGKSGGYLKEDDPTYAKAYIWGMAMPIAISNRDIAVTYWCCWEKDRRTGFIECWSIDPTQEKNDVIILKEEQDAKGKEEVRTASPIRRNRRFLFWENCDRAFRKLRSIFLFKRNMDRASG